MAVGVELVDGGLLVHVGPMFSDKTTMLINRYEELTEVGISVACFKPAIDDRYKPDRISSHNGKSVPALKFEHERPQHILEILPPGLQVALIDEVQFCANEVIGVIEELRRSGIGVLVAGLDLDSNGKPFGETIELTRLARESGGEMVWHTADCEVCGAEGNATMSFAKIPKDGQVLVGAANEYGACCHGCHPGNSHVD